MALKKYIGTWSTKEARHLLNRAGFGGTWDDIDFLVQLGLEKAVQHLVHPNKENWEEPSWTDNPINFRSQDSMQMRMQRTNLTREQRQILRNVYRQRVRNLQYWWIDRMSKTKAPLKEKMTLFWHDHFATSARKVQQAILIYRQNELFRKYSLGNFKKLTNEITKDPAMILYLDNQQNRRGSPNENFARELMELFTIGIGNYTENDIKEAARAFTGWQARGGEFRMIFRPHDNRNKTFMGKSGNLNGNDIIDIIFEQDATAPFIAGKLAAYFVAEEPDAMLNSEIAEELEQNNFEIAPVLERLFQSEAFYDKEVTGNYIKSPVHLAVESIRLLRLEEPPERVMIILLDQAGQSLFYPPNVAGWDHGRAWINTATLTARQNLCSALTTNGRQRFQIQRRMTGAENRMTMMKENLREIYGTGNIPEIPEEHFGDPFEPENVVPRNLWQDPEAVVDICLGYFLVNSPVQSVRENLVTSFAQGRKTAAAVVRLIDAIMNLPEYQIC